MSGGPGTRWNNYLGVPKHLVEINGEKIIERTTRLLNENGQSNIIVLGPKIDDPRYHIPGAQTIPTTGLYDCFHEMFTPLTDSDDTYILLGGDVWYSEECLKEIVQGHDWVGRWRISQVTGQMHEELWSIKITPENKPVLQAELESAKRKLTRATAWDVLRQFKRKGINIDWYELDDMTCDFDEPDDYKNWMKANNKYECC
jgi:hypothetical protein